MSKERIGIEITKTLAKSPFLALELINHLDLHNSIFTCPGLPDDPPRTSAIQTTRVLRAVLERWREPVDGVETLWLGAALKPFKGHVVQGKKELPAVSVVLAEGLKVCDDNIHGRWMHKRAGLETRD